MSVLVDTARHPFGPMIDAPPARSGRSVGAVIDLEILTRARWGARPPQGKLARMVNPAGVIIHHSAGADRSILVAGDIQDMHLDQRGWVDIGYNYLIGEDGKVCQGRPEIDGAPTIGAHSPGMNSTRLGVCLLGDFSLGKDRPSPEQIVAVVALCQWVVVRFGIRPLLISGHRDHRATECPGETLYDLVATVRRLVAQPFAAQIEVEP